MRGFVANAVLIASFALPLCLHAQVHNPAHTAPPSVHASYRTFASGRPAPRQARSAATTAHHYTRLSIPPVQGSSLINSGQTSCILNPSYSNSPYCRQFYSGRPAWGYQPLYPFWMPSGGYDTSEEAPPPPEPETDSGLADEVDNLAAQVGMMRQDQAQREYRSNVPPAASEPSPPATVLVYRDGHQVEVQNYAIVGDTLWVISGQTTRRVPLTDLNISATQHLNESRGIDFNP
jgi:hypothetical protein